jgi:hypothetical protein
VSVLQIDCSLQGQVPHIRRLHCTQALYMVVEHLLKALALGLMAL